MAKKKAFSFNAARGEIRVGQRIICLPARAPVRVTLGSGLIIGGFLGFLPILGFWMVPLGFLILSQDLPMVRRWRRSLVVKLERRKPARSKRRAPPKSTDDEM
jgi:hypothetical protein